MLRKTYQLRLRILFLVPVVFVSVFAFRLYRLQVVRHDHYLERAAKQQTRDYTIVPNRGRILDANGRELAGSTLMKTAYVNGREMRKVMQTSPTIAGNLAHDLAKQFKLEFDGIYQKLVRAKDVVLWRKVDESRVAQISEILDKYRPPRVKKRRSSEEVDNEPHPELAIYFQEEGKRFYPRNQLASQIVGYTTLDDTGDNRGLAGVELQYDEDLRGKIEKYKAQVNAGQRALEPVDPHLLSSTYGNDVFLTIDERIQHCTEKAIARRVSEVNADRGIAVVHSVKTGAVLAMSSFPSFDLNDLANAPEFKRRNRVIADAIEPGSVMKIFTATCLLEDGKITPNDSINCEGGRWSINGRTIVDAGGHGMGTVPFKDVFKNSSNVGTVKAATRLSSQRFYRHLVDFGFGEDTGVDLPGESPGLLRPLKQWSGLSMSSIPMGYEIQVTALQVVAAVSAIANHGVYMQPHIVKEIRDSKGNVVRKIEPKKLRRICSLSTSRQMLDMMELVVIEGTGKDAALADYRVGGKTGTTKKLDPETKRYAMKQYISSFCGVAPIEDPEICVYVWIDNPRGDTYYGGKVSAPVFKEIADMTLKTLKVPPSPKSKPVPSTEVTLSEIKARIEKETDLAYLGAARDEKVTTGCMPPLYGLSMREAQLQLTALNVPFEFEGTGVVIEQYPKPHETILKRDRALITFAPPQHLVSKLAASKTRIVDDDPAPAEDESQPYRIEAATLRLDGGGRSVPLSVTQTPAGQLPKPPASGARPSQGEPTPVPDLDTRVSRSMSRSVGRSNWAEYDRALQAESAEQGPDEATSTASDRTKKAGTEKSDSNEETR